MTQKDNGRLGDWASRSAKARPIEIGTKTACLELFKKGAARPIVDLRTGSPFADTTEVARLPDAPRILDSTATDSVYSQHP